MFQYRGGMQKTYSSKEISYWLQIFDQNGYLDIDEIYNMGGDRDLVKTVKKGVKAAQVGSRRTTKNIHGGDKQWK